MGMEEEVERGRWREIDRARERGAGKGVMPFDTLTLLPHFLSLLQDSRQYQRGRLEERGRKRVGRRGRWSMVPRGRASS